MTALTDIKALYALAVERTQQDEKWGQQDHDDALWGLILAEEVGEVAQAALHTQFGGPAGGKVAAEVVQVGAVAVAWLGAVQRQEAARLRRVYISGPIAGSATAREDFRSAERGINERGGYEAVNPFDVAPLSHSGQGCPSGYHPGDESQAHESSACYMRTDLLALLSCDAIYMLPGWRESRGASVEHAVAVACGMDISGAKA